MEKVLVVDDDPMIRMAHERMLSDNFEVSSVDSGRQVLETFEQHKPDVILLDVNLPDLSGFEVCQRLHEKGLLKHTAVIFVSGHTDLETRITAFNSGGDDFIGKPLDPVELLSKMEVLNSRKRKVSKISQDLKEAQEAVMTVLSTSSELGRVMQFVEHSFSLHSIEKLINSAFELLNSFGLKSACMTEVNMEKSFFSSGGVIKPIEQELLELLRTKGRFYDFNARTQTNYSHVSLLIKNMPLGEPEKYGRIKDLIPAIMGCLNSRLTQIEAQKTLIKQSKDLVYSFDVIQATMRTLTSSLGGNQQKATDRLHKMVYELQVFIQKLGLEEDQEDRVIRYVDEAVEGSLKLLDAGDTIFSSFEQILSSLQETIENQNKVVARITEEQEASTNQQDVADGDDIELF
ncbi:MAG: response regulator [Gammaproteobacteria bacterium]|nr:response regulator [Gammaproteobacteria bacterium]